LGRKETDNTKQKNNANLKKQLARGDKNHEQGRVQAPKKGAHDNHEKKGKAEKSPCARWRVRGTGPVN